MPAFKRRPSGNFAPAAFRTHLQRLVALLDSRLPEVRDAARSSLAEFNFTRYRTMFDLLDEQSAHTTGVLVHKVDHTRSSRNWPKNSLSPSITTKLRGIEMAIAMEATNDVRQQLIDLVSHENVAVRKEAVVALANCHGDPVIATLKSAAADPNHSIAEAAQQSLAKLLQEPSSRRRDATSRRIGMIHDIASRIQLLAAQNYSHEWDRLGHLLNVGLYEVLIVAAVTLLVIVTIVWQTISRRRRRDFDYDSPQRLFADLCRAHKLNWSNRRLLKQLAAARGLKCPSTLFVEPEYFDMTNVPCALKPSAGELRQLRHKLFD